MCADRASGSAVLENGEAERGWPPTVTPAGWRPGGPKASAWARRRVGLGGVRESQSDLNGGVELAERTEKAAVESWLGEARTRVIELTSRTATTSDGVAVWAGHGRAGTASPLGARRRRRHAIGGGVSTVRR